MQRRALMQYSGGFKCSDLMWIKRSVKQFSQEFKLKVVLGSMREELTTNQIAAIAHCT